MSLSGLTPAAKTAVVGLCVYETASLTTGRFPPVSALCRRHRWVEALLLAVLLAHLHARLAEIAPALEEAL